MALITMINFNAIEVLYFFIFFCKCVSDFVLYMHIKKGSKMALLLKHLKTQDKHCFKTVNLISLNKKQNKPMYV